MPVESRPQEYRLTLVKLAHTAVWAVMAGSILALPFAAWAGRFNLAFWLSMLVFAECLVLGFNQGRCPLTDLAARYTSAREPNFDIYLPHWLAEHNKALFGTLFLCNELIVLWFWFKR